MRDWFDSFRYRMGQRLIRFVVYLCRRFGCLAFAAWLACLGVVSAQPPTPPDLSANEVAWAAYLGNRLQIRLPEERVLVEHRLFDGSRVDLLGTDWAAEVDWARKWAEAIGQARLYARLSERKRPVVLLMVRRLAEEQIYIGRAIAAIGEGPEELWVFDCEKNRWIRGPFRYDLDAAAKSRGGPLFLNEPLIE